jgi:prevent-host-death family protein
MSSPGKTTKKKLPYVGLKELRENMETYIKRIDAGESITVFRRSTPIFKLCPVDEWGDEGQWKTVVDFRDKNGVGIDAHELLAALKKNGQND